MARRNGGFIGTDGLDAPDPPTGVTPTAGDASVSVAFTAPTDTGTSAITGFVATTDAGDGATGSSSPITISSLTNSTAYTARVYAINAFGTSAASDASASFTPVQLQRAVFAGGSGGEVGTYTNLIDFVEIPTLGNASDFGDLTVGRHGLGGASSKTRGVFANGQTAGSDTVTNVMDYITLGSTGNATDFGDATSAIGNTGVSGCGSDTRGLFSGGSAVRIDYITIASTGNALDFGDMTVASASDNRNRGSFSSTTRGIWSGGGGGNGVDHIEYVTIANTGNTTDFGNCTGIRNDTAGCSNAVRGLTFGAENGQTLQANIEYITIASTGNGTDFGDLTGGRGRMAGAASSTRALMAGGLGKDQSGNGDEFRDFIEYVTIASTGNSQDFGNLISGPNEDFDRAKLTGVSSAHGGLA
ncbi:fibronectin type III domain-containing protein [Gammaproteobacteria bacterium]|nr:fibronectin type III domain-containing protein [Gammaproteobacteria bacterium]